MTIYHLDLKQCDCNRLRIYNVKDDRKLKKDIKRRGQRDPILVTRVGKNRYSVIDGVRRIIVLQSLGFPYVRAKIKDDVLEGDAILASPIHVTFMYRTFPLSSLRALYEGMGISEEKAKDAVRLFQTILAEEIRFPVQDMVTPIQLKMEVDHERGTPV